MEEKERHLWETLGGEPYRLVKLSNKKEIGRLEGILDSEGIRFEALWDGRKNVDFWVLKEEAVRGMYTLGRI